MNPNQIVYNMDPINLTNPWGMDHICLNVSQMLQLRQDIMGTILLWQKIAFVMGIISVLLGIWISMMYRRWKENAPDK